MENSERELAPKATSSSQNPRSGFSLQKLDDWCQKGIFGLVLGILIYSPLALGATRAGTFAVIEWLTVAVLGLWLCRFWFNPKHRLLWPPVCWAVVAFMGYSVARYFTADVEYIARQEMIRVLIYGFLFLAILHNLYHSDQIQTISMVLLGLGTLLAMYGVGQFLTSSEHIYGMLRPEMYFKRGSGTFINPDHFAGYLEMLLPLSLALTLTGRSGPVRKILFGYATLAMFAGIFVSVSVGGWIATGLSLVVMFIWLMRIRDYRLQGLLLMVAMVILSVVFILKAELSPNRLDHLSNALKGDNIRLKIWKPAVKMWQDHPWFGVGPGHFDLHFRAYRTDENTSPQLLQSRPEYVHNDYLNTLVDWGILGAVLVLLAWVLFYTNVFGAWKYVQRARSDLAAKRSNRASFVMGGSVGLLAILIHSLFDFNMHIPANAILMTTLMALVASHFRYATERHWHRVHLPMRLLATLILLAAIAYLAPQSWRLTQESQWLEKANKNQIANLDRITALESALTVEPQNHTTAYELGEAYWFEAKDTQEDSSGLIPKAINAYQRSIALNPFYPFSHAGLGKSLDLLKEHDKAMQAFEKAHTLDPYGTFTSGWMGWHYAQTEDWTNAQQWFRRAVVLYRANSMATNYLDIVTKRLNELQTK